MPQMDSPVRVIVRNVLVVVGVVLILYVIWLLRKPITWLVIATFLAIALAGPVNFFQRYMKHLKENEYTVIAMRDLAKYVDPTKGPSDPLAPIQRRIRRQPDK